MQPKVRSKGRLGTDPLAIFCGSILPASPPVSDDDLGADCPSNAATVSRVFNRKLRKERKRAGNRAGTERGIRFADPGRRAQCSVPVERQWRALNSPGVFTERSSPGIGHPKYPDGPGIWEMPTKMGMTMSTTRTRARCPQCNAEGETIAESYADATGYLAPVAIV